MTILYTLMEFGVSRGRERKGEPPMNLSYYRNFCTVVEAGSMTKAAEQLHVAQPAISRQMQALEAEFGVRLLVVGRGHHQLKLTDAGWLFYKRAKQICQMEDETYRDMSDAANGLNGTLNISIAPSRSRFFVTRYAKPFSRLYPQITYNIRESYYVQLLDDVLRGVSEIGIANAPIPENFRFDILSSRPEHYYLVGRKNNPWIDLTQPYTSLAVLQGVPLACARGHWGLLETRCLEEDVKPYPFAIVGTRVAAVDYAMENLAIAVVPLEEMEMLPKELIRFRIEDPRVMIHKTIIKLKGRELSMPMRKFLEVYQREIDNLKYR